MCYAYRDVDSEELLIEHLVNVAECCKNRWEFNALSNKISRLLGIAEDDVRQAIILAALLHDIGKAVQEFQHECAKSVCKEFPKHYLISMFLAHIAFRASGISISTDDVIRFFEDRINGIGKNEILELLVILPIAFHHYHQVRGITSYKMYQDVVGISVIEKFAETPKIWLKCCEDLAKLSDFVYGNPWSTVVRELRNMLPNIERYRQSDLYRGSKVFTGNFYEAVEKNVKLVSVTLSRAILESIMGLINLCDGRVAYEARAKRATVK